MGFKTPLAYYQSSVAAGFFVYSGGEDGTVRKLDSSTGNQVWSYNAGSQVFGLSVDSDGFVYAGTNVPDIRKIDPDGNLVWVFDNYGPNPNSVTGTAPDQGGFVHTSSNDDVVTKINSSGSQVWKYFDHTDNVAGVDVDTNGFVYTASSDNRKLDSSGSLVWIYTPPAFSQGVKVDLVGNVYIAMQTNVIHKVDSNGSLIYSASFGSGSAGDYGRNVGLGQNHFYAATNDGFVRKFDNAGGSLQWNFSGHSAVVWDVVPDPEDFVYSCSQDSTVRKIDPSGSQVWSFSGHSGQVYSIAVDPGRIGAGFWS